MQGADSSGGAALLDAYKQRFVSVFSPSLVLDRGDGAWVWDVDGNRYLDLLAGIAVNALGYAHPAWAEAVAAQASRLAHVSNLFASVPQIELAGKLLEICGAEQGGKVFFANSGTEAAEAALKAALRWSISATAASDRGSSDSVVPTAGRILALKGSFHGRTLGALALTGNLSYRAPFERFIGDVEFLPPDDLPTLQAAFAAGPVNLLVLEVIQGEAGVIPLGSAYLRAARELTSAHGALLWIDEVQTGCGRCGAWMAYQNEDLAGKDGVKPDLVTLAKGLGGGFPIGALVAMNPASANLLKPGQHGTTFGGGPLATATALATLDVIERCGLIRKADQLGLNWREALMAVPGVKTTRGAGLLIGVVLDEPLAPAVVKVALEAGFLINAPAPNVLRLAPPLILGAEQAQLFTAALPTLINQAKGRA
jgi:acetylornithine aminotransferase